MDTLEAEIYEYLTGHPHAMDTVDGMASWRLERQRRRVHVDAVSRAIGGPVERGVVQYRLKG
jgi:hypothetical protein